MTRICPMNLCNTFEYDEMFSCQSKYKKSQALLDFIYVPKNWNLSKFNDDISYHFQVFVNTFFEQAFTRLCFFRSIDKYTQMKYLCCKFNSSSMQDDACCKNDINQQLIKITASLHYQHQTNIFHMRSLPNAILGRRRSKSTSQWYERCMPTLERCRVMTIKRCMDLERSIRRHGKHETILT